MLMPLILWVLIIILFIPFYVVSMFIFLLYCLLVNFIVWASQPQLVAQLASRDIVFTSDDFQGKVRKNMMNLAIVDGNIDLQKLREAVQERILSVPYFNRLNCRPVVFMGYYFWEVLDYKVESQITELNRVCTDDELKTLVPAWSSEPYNPSGPLWSILVIPITGNRTALAFKMHHMNGDGVCFMKLMEAYVDPVVDLVGWKSVEIKETKPFSWLHWAYAWYNFPWVTLKAYRLAGVRKGFRPRAFAGDACSSWTNLSSDKIKTVRRLAKCTFSTVLAGILSNAFYRLLQKSGKAADIPETLRLVVPVPWPNRPKGRMSNHVAFVHAELPLGGELSPFYQFEKSVKNNYISGMHGVVWQFFRGMYVVPSPLLHRYTAWGEKKLPAVIISSVRGPVSDVFILGNKVLESIPIIGLGCTMGVNAATTTYGPDTTFALRVSKEILPTQELLDQLLNKYLHEELDFFYQKLLNDEEGKTESKENHIKIDMS